MLPNTANMDDLILDFEKAERNKTLTFAIKQNTGKGVGGTESSSILGFGVLGKLILNNSEIHSPGYEYIIGGKIDGLAALQQHIYLTLSIEADQYIIYPYTYGVKTLDLIGKPYYYVMAVIPQRIEEALLSDDRITGVSDFEFQVSGNKLMVKFVVHSIYGDIKEETEVAF